MQKVTIITGPRNSGKTTKLLGLIKYRKAIKIDSKALRHSSIPDLEKDTEVIAIDHVYAKDISELIGLIYSKYINIEKQGEARLRIDRPELIVAIDSKIFNKHQWTKRPYVEIIKLETDNDKVSENEPKPNKISKGNKLGKLLDEAEKISYKMKQLFIDNNIAELDLSALPKADYDRWLALKAENDKLGQEMCKVILDK